MRIVNPGQFLTGLQLEMTKQELFDWLHLKTIQPMEIVSDNLQDPERKVKRHFYIIQGQPVTIYEIPVAEDELRKRALKIEA